MIAKSTFFMSLGFQVHCFGVFFPCCLTLCFVYAVAPWSTWDLVLMLESRVPIWSLFVIQVMMCWWSVFIYRPREEELWALCHLEICPRQQSLLSSCTRIVSSVQVCQTHGQDKITYFSLRLSWWEWSLFITKKALVRVFPFLAVSLA